MAATGDWVTPRLYGQPWFEKPVLYYWAGAIGFLLHLPAEWALRLPSALGALAAAFAIGWLARKHYGGSAAHVTDLAVLAPLLFSTTVAAIGFARAATPDMLFSASIALAMASAATVLRYSGSLRAATACRCERAAPRRNALAAIRRLPRTWRACKRTGGDPAGRRRRRALGAVHRQLARRRCDSPTPTQSSRFALWRFRGICSASAATLISSGCSFCSTISSATSLRYSSTGSRSGFSCRSRCSRCCPG